MKKYLILAMTLLPFLANPVLSQEPKSGEEGPLQNFERMGKTNAQILAILEKAQKPGFLYFTTDWCVACKGLEKDTFATSEFPEDPLYPVPDRCREEHRAGSE
jgi:thiol:disulfide interchange protein